MENPFEYRREMDTLAFSPEQKDRLASRVAEAAGAAKPRAARRPMRRIVTTVAVAAVVVAASCGAMATGLVGNAFDSVFGTSKTEVIDKIGRPIGAGATDNGISVTADAIVGDKYNACVVYTIRRTDGKPLGLPSGVPVKNLWFDHTDCDLHGGNPFGAQSSFGSSWFTASSSDANAAQYVDNISSDQPLSQGTVRADFQNLQYRVGDSPNPVTLCKGEWKFSFHVNYEDSSVALPAGQTFKREGIHFKIDEVSVSPVGMRVAYEADREADLTEDPKSNAADGKMNSKMEAESDCYFGVPIVITKKDGSTIDMTNSGGSMGSGKGKTNCVRSGVFKEIVTLGDLKSVTVGGVEIPIDAK